MYDLQKTLDRLIEGQVASGQVKGASALVFYRGKEIYYNAFGYADAEKGRLMKRDTIIHLFSMTKPVTAAAVMILVERGELDLRDPVSVYLPCFAKMKVWSDLEGEVAAEREITIFDLLTMTSGIVYPNEENEPGRRMRSVLDGLVARRLTGERVDTQEFVRGIASVPLAFHPGTDWRYGYSADVLGGIVEAVSGRSYGEFLRKELFDPLEMPDTGFCIPGEKQARAAQFYEPAPDGTLHPFTGCHLGEYYGEDVAFESGGAGLVSTLDDYSHFASMLAHGGRYLDRQILGRKTVEFMVKNHLTEEQRRALNWDSILGYGYGCLMRVLVDQEADRGIVPPGEFGWDGWTGNYVAMDRKEDLVLLYFIQRCGAGTTPFIRKLRMAVYGALET